MRKIFFIAVFAIVLGASLRSPPSLLAAEEPAPADVGDVSTPQIPPADLYVFNEDVQGLDDLDADSAREAGLTEEAEGGRVYVTPSSCKEFSIYLETKRRRLERLENEVEQKIEVLRKLKTEFEAVSAKYGDLEGRVKKLVQRDPMDPKNNPELAKMVKIYESLPPEEAAARLRNLDLDMTLAVLKGMKPKKLGQVMSALEPKLAAALSSQMVRGF